MFSFIVPMYNAEKYIEECLKSILRQEYGDFEVLLINDGCTDRTMDLCSGYEKIDKRVKVINQENRGQAAARNRGLKEAQGEWVWFVDADDWIEKQALRKLTKVISSLSDIEIVAFDFYKHRNERADYLSNVQYGVKNRGEFFKFLFNARYHFGMIWSSIFLRKYLIENHLYFDEKLSLSEDADFMVRAGICLNRIIVVKEALYHYRVIPNSVSRTYKSDMMEQYLCAVNKISLTINNLDYKHTDIIYDTYVQYVCVAVVLNDIFYPGNGMALKQRKKRLESLLENSSVQSALKSIDYKDLGIVKGIILLFAKKRQGIFLSIFSWLKCKCYVSARK